MSKRVMEHTLTLRRAMMNGSIKLEKIKRPDYNIHKIHSMLELSHFAPISSPQERRRALLDGCIVIEVDDK